MKRKLALTVAGGFCGTIARYLLSAPLLWATHGAPGTSAHLPYDILVINLLGALLIGLLYGATERAKSVAPDVRVALGTGFLGGFTTFSSFMVGTVSLAQQGHELLALTYLVVSLVGGLVLAQAGHILGDSMWQQWSGARSVAGPRRPGWLAEVASERLPWRLEEADDLDGLPGSTPALEADDDDSDNTDDEEQAS